MIDTTHHSAEHDSEEHVSPEPGSPSSIQRLEDEPSNEDLCLSDSNASELSREFVGRWEHLVSTTNWEKGLIIYQWRTALADSGTGPAGYSDEAWRRRVGGVSAQHVGRLRRVYERFGSSYRTYPSLHWSHFLAALDWDDAEMWLEGAVQAKWSVSQLRRTRWESLGSIPDAEPPTSDFRDNCDDEDYAPLSEADSTIGIQDAPRQTSPSGPRYDEPDFGDSDDVSSEDRPATLEDELAPWEEDSSVERLEESPFARLPSLPGDVADAVEQMKLAIIRHRASHWVDVPKDSIVQVLDALKKFVLLPN